MRGYYVEIPTEKKRLGSTGMKKPVMATKTNNTREKKEKEKMIVLMIIQAMREYYSEMEAMDVCLNSTQHSIATAEDTMKTEKEEKTEEIDFKAFFNSVYQYVENDFTLSSDVLYAYIKKQVIKYKRSQLLN